MFLKNLFEQKLLELDWYDRSPLAKQLEPYRGKYIHFSNGIPGRRPSEQHFVKPPEAPSYWDRDTTRTYKRGVARAERQNMTAAQPILKINTKSFHKDPRGIYFYPVDYILTHSEKMRTGQQFATDFKFFFVCDIKEDQSGVNLAYVTWEQVYKIAKRNGWFEELDKFQDSPHDQKMKILPRYGNPEMPGSVLWHFVESLINAHKTTWAKAFAGITYIRDPGKAIIHSNEPDQIAVLDPSIITIVKSGETGAMRREQSDKTEYWQHAVVGVMKQVRGEFGGDLVWSKKTPTLSFKVGKVSATLTFKPQSYDSRISLLLDYTSGRAKDSMWFDTGDLEKKDAGQIVSEIAARLRMVDARKGDLAFKPALSEQDAQRLIMAKIAGPGDYAWTTEITNDQGVKNQQMQVQGRFTRDVDDVTLRTRVIAFVTAGAVSFACGFAAKAAKHEMVSGYNSSYGRQGQPTIQDNVDALFEEIKEHMLRSFDFCKPQERNANSYSSYRERRFQTDEQFQAYKGWLVLNCGLSFEGRMAAAFPDEVTAYHAYDDKDRLHGLIDYVLGQFDERNF